MTTMMKSFGSLVLLVLAATAAQITPARADQIATAPDELPDLVGFYKPGLHSKADSSLAAVHAEFKDLSQKGKSAGYTPSNRFVQVSSGSILVDVRATSDGAVLLDDLVQLGLTNGHRYGDVVSGLLPLTAIDNALALQSLRGITASPRPITHTGSITSQGDAALAADVARTTYSVDGSGVGVGVISDGYDTLGGASADIASGDLPAGGVTLPVGESTLCGLLVFCIDEGRAMLQIIHDVAPGADLYFQSGIDGIASYASAISSLAAAGADVIVDDLLIINEPMFQDGIVSQAVDSIVASGVVYFSAAGNSGRKSYEAAFDNSGEIFCIEFFDPIGDCDPQFERVGLMHDFDPGPGVDNYMNITIPENSVMTIAMQWDQPFGGSGPSTDHDIVLLDASGETYITISANDNIVMGEGWEALQYDNSEFLGNGTDFSIILTYDDVDSVGPPATLIKLVVFGDDVVLNEYSTNGSTSYGHANAAGAESVGAAFFLDTPLNGTSPPILEPYSSAGGTPILFDTNGVLLAVPEIRQKPDITAVDGVNTTFFFDDSHGSDGIDDFFGTSAAAPHAAGVAALLLQAKPDATPDELRSALKNTAIDMGVAGVDFDSGHGLIQADAAIAELLSSSSASFERIAVIPNMGGSAAPELGVAISNNFSGYVRDAGSDALLGSQTFNGARAPLDFGIADIDGSPALAVLDKDVSGRAWVEVRDAATGTIVKDVWFSSGYTPHALAVLPDMNGNNSSELAVLMTRDSDNDRAWVHIKDSLTMAYVNNVWFEAGYTPHDVEYVPNIDGNAGPELAVLMTRDADNDRAWVHVKDALTSAYVKNIWFQAGYTPNDLAIIDNLDGNPGAEVAVLMVRDSDSRPWVHMKDALTGAYVNNVWFDQGYTPSRLAIVPNLDANSGDELAILTTRDSDSRAWVHVKDALSSAYIRSVWFQAGFTPRDFAVVPDMDANPGDELAVLGVTGGGQVQVEIKDAKTISWINNVNFP
ncbi:MAG: S8 family peptidase [Woeseiaceae bacterium]